MFSTSTLRKFHWTRLLQWFSLTALAITWLLLLLVSISPLESIYFVELGYDSHSSFASIGGSVRFGVWGYCYSDLLEVPVLKSSHDGSWQCSPRHLGYQIDSSIAKALHVDGLTNAISSGLAFALALHLVDVILVLITAATLFLPERINRYRHLGSVSLHNTSLAFFIASSFTLVMAIVTVIIDCVLSDGIKRVAAHVLQGSSGSALRLIEVAAVILLIVWICAGINMYYHRKISRSSKVHETTQGRGDMRQNTWPEFGLTQFDSNLLVAQSSKFSAAPLRSP